MVPPNDRISDDDEDQAGGDPGLRGLIGRARHAAHPGAEERRRGAAGQRRPAELEEADERVEPGPELRPRLEPHDAAVDRLAGVERVADRLEVEDDLQHDRDGRDQEDGRRVLDRRGRPDQPFAAADRRRRHDRARADHLEQVAGAERRRRGQVRDVPARQLAVVGRERAAPRTGAAAGAPELVILVVSSVNIAWLRAGLAGSSAGVVVATGVQRDIGLDVVMTSPTRDQLLDWLFLRACASGCDDLMLVESAALLLVALERSRPPPTGRSSSGPIATASYRGAPIVSAFPPGGPKVVWSKESRSGPQRPGRRRRPRDPLSPGRRSRGGRVARRRERQDAVAVRLSDSLSRRLRLRRRAARGAGGRRRGRLYVRRGRAAARYRLEGGEPLWSEKTRTAVRRAEGILRRGRLAARRGRPGDREYRRRESGHHRLRRAQGQRSSGRPPTTPPAIRRRSAPRSAASAMRFS